MNIFQGISLDDSMLLLKFADLRWEECWLVNKSLKIKTSCQKTKHKTLDSAS